MGILLFIFICYLAAFVLTAGAIPFSAILIPLLVCITAIFFGAASLIVDHLWKPPFFSLGWAFTATFVGLIICPAVAILFAVGNLVRLRLISRKLPTVINAIIDAVIALNLFTKLPWTIDHGLVQCMVPVGNPLGMERCKDFASKILVLIWLYLAFAFTLATVHLALFFMRFFRIFGLALALGQNTGENGNVSSLRVPIHTSTFEFSFKVLRQEPTSGQDHAREEQAQNTPVEERSRLQPLLA